MLTKYDSIIIYGIYSIVHYFRAKNKYNYAEFSVIIFV